jgi:aspartokinase/homoserine dehydrogenase 1
MPRPRPAPTVHKFGGAALADGAAVRHAVAIVAAWRATAGARGQPAPGVVVASAMAGVTDALLDAARRAAAGEDGAARDAVAALRARHHEAAVAALGEDDADPAGREARAAYHAAVDAACDDLARIVGGLAALGELSAASTDAVLARGERLSARLVAVALARAGVAARLVDATCVVATDGRAGAAFPDLARTAAACARVLAPLVAEGVVPVVPGFLGAAGDVAADDAVPVARRRVVTLGRGGSDLTATTLARALGARDVLLWKDVPGLLTADPRVVPDARVIPALAAREASELAYHGAKVLHPRALIPLAAPVTAAHVPPVARGARVVVRPFAAPDAPGTTIHVHVDASPATDATDATASAAPVRLPVKAVSAIAGQALVTLRGTGMLGVPGIAARAFGALERGGISVSLISQASSEQSICLCIPASAAAGAAALLDAAFAAERARGEVEGVDVAPAVATVAVVGSGMAGVPGIAARLFGALADAGINIVAIAQGSSELNISVIVHADHAAAAQRAVHAAFRLDRIGGGAADAPATADVVLLGFGRVGRELARQLARRAADARAAGTAPPVRIVGVADSGGYVFAPGGLAPRRLAALARAKQGGRALAECPGGRQAPAAQAVAHMAAHALARPILVDLTAGDTTALLSEALAHGMDLVLANKRPLAEVSAEAAGVPVLHAAAERGRRVRHEATVGAGLPVIDTVAKLRESGDTILGISGSPSGTLGFLFAELSRGRAFGEVLADAMRRGYTEPDPREDLSGMDVARKAVILARLVGWPGTLADVRVESLVPAALAAVPLDDFLARAVDGRALDAAWARRVEAARARGRVLRYTADVTARRVRVGIVEVDAAHPLAALNGTDNQFVFTTRRYRTRPLVITGPGAGPAVTAAGVLNDVLALAGAAP